MAYRNDGPFTEVAGEALEADRFVKYSSNTVVYCDAGDTPIGITMYAVALGKPVAIDPIVGNIRRVTTSKLIAVDTACYTANDGKVGDTGVEGEAPLCYLRAASTGDGGIVPALVFHAAGGNSTPADNTVTNAKMTDNAKRRTAIIPVENLAAGGDISGRPVFLVPNIASTLISIGILTQGAPAGVDDANTSVIAVTDDADNAIVSKTYNTATQPPTSDYESLGALDGTNKALTAAEHLKLSVTNGATADLPAFSLVIVYACADA